MSSFLIGMCGLFFLINGLFTLKKEERSYPYFTVVIMLGMLCVLVDQHDIDNVRAELQDELIMLQSERIGDLNDFNDLQEEFLQLQYEHYEDILNGRTN